MCDPVLVIIIIIIEWSDDGVFHMSGAMFFSKSCILCNSYISNFSTVIILKLWHNGKQKGIVPNTFVGNDKLKGRVDSINA